MRFTLEIECENAAFEDSPADEVARILVDLAGRLRRGEVDDTGRRARLVDVNGNTVGACGFRASVRT